MRAASLVDRLRNQLCRLYNADDGNVAIIFAMALIPLIGLIGGAIDYNRASAVRTAMQSALDATALAMAKDASALSASELNEKAAAYFAASFSGPEAKAIKIGAVYSGDDGNGSSIAITADGSIQTKFLGIVGIDTIPIGSFAKTAWGLIRLRVALVLDNTGSMASGGKMTALKTASKKLLTQLQNAASKPEDVYVSIIPFNKDVNVGGPGNYGAGWVDWASWDNANGTCSKTDYHSKGECASHGKVWTAANHNTWNGCITDRDPDYDIKNTAPGVLGPVAFPSPLFPAEQSSSCPVTLMAMSHDWTELNKKIDQMVPNGNTNQPIGLAWGWMSLSDGAPLNTPAKDPNLKYQDVIILLTDGMNTENRTSTVQSVIDKRQEKICANVKAANITIYTILVMAGNSAVLQKCASSADKYFALTSADQIISAFDAIGIKLSQLRIAQ